MKLYIQIENGQPINHPAFEDNLMQAFNQIPDHWEEFVRIEKPVPTIYQVLDSDVPTYQKVDGVWTDVWALRNMTSEEILAKQQVAMSEWAAREQAENWSAWTFDPSTCTYVPPIPRPAPDAAKLDAGISTVWCGAENNWKDTPAHPVDDGQYKFDFLAWNWVAA